MKKQLLSILLCLIMVVGLLPTAVLAEETAPTFDLTKDLEDITIPDDLVTCICTKTGERKSYGKLPNGFSDTVVKKEYGVWTVIIRVKPDVYRAQFNKDTGSTHTQDTAHAGEFITPIQFTLKYEGGKWELLGEMPKNKMLHFTCGGGHVYQGDIPVINLRAKTDTRILVTENRAWEYSIDNGANWQGSCLFKDLSPGTKYTIIARVKETATHQPSANSEPLTVTTMHIEISEELKKQLRAVASGYEGEYNGMEHEAVIVNDTKMPEDWTIAGYTTDEGNSFGNSIPKIKDAGTLRVGVKFVHPDYLMNITHYYTAEITPKPVTADMIADIPSQHYTGHPIHPEPEIKDGNTDLEKDKDFTYSYDTNTSPEHGGKVTINGKGNYKGMASKSFNIVNEITEITEDDLKDLEIPTLVTVKCTTTNSSKEYGKIPGGFTLGKPYMEGGVLKAVVSLNLPVYKDKYDTDTKKTHQNAGLEGNTHTAFTLKYVKNKWELDGNFPAVVLLVTCNGSHENQTYTVTFDGNGGVPSVIRMATIDQKLPELPTATHSGRYSFDGWYTEKNGGTKITTATLFDKDTTVYAHWTYTGSTGGGGVTTYPITVKSAKNGDVTASHKSAAKGTTITLTVDPDKGYVLDTLTVLDGKDKDLKLTEKNGKFTFTMPASKVTVAATFKASTPTGKNPFIDVPAGSYYEDAVIWAVDKGITTGTSATTFNPNGICTRAQAVTFLWRAAGSPAAKSAVMPFTDVKAGSYYYDAVLWAVEQGITKGTSDTMFSPDATCTRAQIVTFLWRSQKSPAAGMANPFADVAADTYYIDAVLWAVKHNITVGTTFSIFSPDEECTRAQIVTFLYRARNK
jgi:hypothetical protein